MAIQVYLRNLEFGKVGRWTDGQGDIQIQKI